MPRIIVENVPEKSFDKVADKIAPALSESANVPIEWISVSLLSTKIYTPSFPVINVYWNPRPKETEVAGANAIAKVLQEAGFGKMEIYFHHLRPEGYYPYDLNA